MLHKTLWSVTIAGLFTFPVILRASILLEEDFQFKFYARTIYDCEQYTQTRQSFSFTIFDMVGVCLMLCEQENQGKKLFKVSRKLETNQELFSLELVLIMII